MEIITFKSAVEITQLLVFSVTIQYLFPFIHCVKSKQNPDKYYVASSKLQKIPPPYLIYVMTYEGVAFPSGSGVMKGGVAKW